MAGKCNRGSPILLINIFSPIFHKSVYIASQDTETTPLPKQIFVFQYIFLIFGFRVLKSNQTVLLNCPDMLIPFGVIWNLHKKVVLQNSKVLNS